MSKKFERVEERFMAMVIRVLLDLKLICVSVFDKDLDQPEVGETSIEQRLVFVQGVKR